MYSVTSGKGEPLILLHGLFGSYENLAGIGRLLADSFAVTGFDLPHHGRSRSQDPVSLRNFADTLADTLDQRFPSQAVAVVGHSLGGKVAMELALLFPTLVSKLVVLDIAPKAYQRRHETIFAAINAVTVANEKAHLNSAKEAGIFGRKEADLILKQTIASLPVRSFLLKNWQRSKDGGGTYGWRCNMQGLQENYDDLVRENASNRVDIPTYFLAGGNSDYVGKDDVALIRSRFPSAKVEWLADTEHWLHAEQPQEVARRVKAFLT